MRVLPGMYMCVINNQQVVLHAAGCDWYSGSGTVVEGGLFDERERGS